MRQEDSRGLAFMEIMKKFNFSEKISKVIKKQHVMTNQDLVLEDNFKL